MESDCYFEECKDCVYKEYNNDLLCCLFSRLSLAQHRFFLALPLINKIINVINKFMNDDDKLIINGDKHCHCFEKKYGHWIYWDGWTGNTVQRIDDAVCSECGYKHPLVWRTEEDKPNSTPDKLADVCPNCNAVMNKWAGKYKEDLKT